MIPHEPTAIRQYIERRGISSWSIAAHLGIDQGHLYRVLTGKRPGSAALLRSVAELAESLGRRRRSQADIGRLISAAEHVFFLKRGGFQSEIFNDLKGKH